MVVVRPLIDWARIDTARILSVTITDNEVQRSIVGRVPDFDSEPPIVEKVAWGVPVCTRARSSFQGQAGLTT